MRTRPLLTALCGTGLALAACGVAPLAVAAPAGAATAAAAAAGASATAAHSAAMAGDRSLAPDTRFYIRPPDQGAVRQGISLLAKGDVRDAALIAAMEATPQAVWLTGGTPAQVRRQVRLTMLAAALAHRVPVFVAYDIPGRDCAQFSAGGALSQADYQAWIGGVSAGLGNGHAVVLLEPDSLGLLPSTCGAASYPFTDAGRYAELNFAVTALEQQPNVSVYLDGTHSAWLSVGQISSELVQAGVQRAQGFFIDVSNYQPTAELIDYGTWISDCIAFASDPEEGGWRLGHYDYCASQYFPATQSDFSTWDLSTQWYAANMGTAVASTHFVIDTSRNGQGPNDMSAYGRPPYNQSASRAQPDGGHQGPAARRLSVGEDAR